MNPLCRATTPMAIYLHDHSMATDSWPLYDQTSYSSRNSTTILQPD